MKGFELAYNEALRIFLSRDDVTAAMIGQKHTAGKPTGELAICFGVVEKKPISKLESGKILPANILGVQTDIQTIKPRLDLYTPSSSVMVGGLSIGMEGGINSGTLGGVFRNTITGNLCGLTNFHVLADLVQETTPKIPLQYVSHPGNDDFGSSESVRVGETLNYILDEVGDAGSFSLYPNASPLISIASIMIQGCKMPSLLDEVAKVGKSTGAVKNCVVDAIGYLATDYSDYGYGTVNIYCMQLIPSGSDPLEEIGISGDSGSVVYDSTDNYGVGLYFAHAVTTEQYYGYAAFLDAVLDSLNLEVVPVVETTSGNTASCLCASETKKAVSLSFSSSGKADYLSCRVFALTNEETVYATLEEYALALGYETLAALLEDYDCETELEYAELCGYLTVEDYLNSVKIPSLLDNLAAGGITIA